MINGVFYKLMKIIEAEKVKEIDKI